MESIANSIAGAERFLAMLMSAMIIRQTVSGRRRTAALESEKSTEAMGTRAVTVVSSTVIPALTEPRKTRTRKARANSIAPAFLFI